MSRPPPAVALAMALANLRGHAAIARSLLDELDRLAPPYVRSQDAACALALGVQFAEVLAELSSRLAACASAMNDVSAQHGAEGP